MTTIIAGRFIGQSDAADAMAELVKSGFLAEQMTSFFVSPPGQHDSYPIGGDENVSAGAEAAGGGAAYGVAGGGGIGLLVGLATAPVLGPVAVIAGAAAGAYVGALAGALQTMEAGDGTISEATSALESVPQPSAPSRAEPRKSGTVVAVAVATMAEQTSAVDVLRVQQAADIECAEGRITAGEWTDFDPLTRVVLVGH